MKNRGLGISLSYVNTALNMLCGLYLSSFLLRMLGDTEYGIYQTVCSFVNYLVLLEFGIGTVITRNISVCRAQNRGMEEIRKNVSTLWTINVILTVVIAIAATVFYFCLGSIYHETLTPEQIVYGKQIFLFEVGYLIVSFLSNTLNGVLLGFEKYEIQPIISILRLIVRTTLLTMLIFSFRKSLIIAIVDGAISLVTTLYLVFYCNRKLSIRLTFRGFEFRIFREALPLCLAIMIQVLVNQANNTVDKFIIGIKLDPESVALYSIGLYIYSMFSALTTIPISMYAPQVVSEVASGVDHRTLEDHMIRPSRLIVLIGGTILFAFIAVGRQFVSVFYGSEYLLAWVVAIIIMCPMLINMSTGILINVLDAKNKRMSRSFVLLITTIANIVLTVFWIDRWGMVGASAATALCTFLGQITLMNIYYAKKMEIDVLHMYHGTFKGILPFQIIACACAGAVAWLIPHPLVALIAGGGVYVIVFCALFYPFGATSDEKNLVGQFVKKILHKR